ncbi:MAG TPA: hypothetical protein VEQ11_03435 [Chloroflexota bacterium]|nr:hypothetical protein [Chloroflexota bacterium]
MKLIAALRAVLLAVAILVSAALPLFVEQRDIPSSDSAAYAAVAGGKKRHPERGNGNASVHANGNGNGNASVHANGNGNGNSSVHANGNGNDNTSVHANANGNDNS